MDDAAEWLGHLPQDLDAQRRLGRLLAWYEQDNDVRWLTVPSTSGEFRRLCDALGGQQEEALQVLPAIAVVGSEAID